ncbi:MAG TPA: hypothetical protein VMJ12_02840 [Candidatus Acidoferrales bacterium]|nr:hypothetical protein [Candidatus Acidoferrales bacterium]
MKTKIIIFLSNTCVALAYLCLALAAALTKLGRKLVKPILFNSIAVLLLAICAANAQTFRAVPVQLPVYLAPGTATNFPIAWQSLQSVITNSAVIFTNNVNGTGAVGFYTNIWYVTNS